MAYAYLVTGSEDGAIGIFGNRKRAIERAIAYVQQMDADYVRSENEFGDVGFYGDHLSAYVEKWLME